MFQSPVNLFISSMICVAFFGTFIQPAQSHEDRYNTTNPIESPRSMFFSWADERCSKAVREDDAKCYKTYSAMYNKVDEKSHCCYYFSMYNCLENAVKKKCDLRMWKTFKANLVFEGSTQFITKNNCPNYPNYEACQFPLKKVIIIAVSASLIVLVIISLILYRHYRTGFHKVATNDV